MADAYMADEGAKEPARCDTGWDRRRSEGEREERYRREGGEKTEEEGGRSAEKAVSALSPFGWANTIWPHRPSSFTFTFAPSPFTLSSL